jgi:hypothetical protein
MSHDKPDAAGRTSRRGFLKALGLGAAQVTAQTSLASTSEPKTVAPVVVLPESRVAGAEHRLSVEARLALQKGARLAFRREPDNRWDKRAVSIHLVDAHGMADEIIGYVPRHENTMICDLLDAGHDIAGELLETEKIFLHNKVAPGAEPASDMRFIEEVKRTEDGGRIVKLEGIRPQFRAWIATGQIASARPAEWFEIPDDPEWVRIVRQHKPMHLSHAAHFALGIDWKVGMELGVHAASGRSADWPTHSLHLADGTRIGDLDGPHHVTVAQALKQGRRVRAVVTEVGKQKWSGHADTPLPLIEIHATRHPTLPSQPDNAADGPPDEENSS